MCINEHNVDCNLYITRETTRIKKKEEEDALTYVGFPEEWKENDRCVHQTAGNYFETIRYLHWVLHWIDCGTVSTLDYNINMSKSRKDRWHSLSVILSNPKRCFSRHQHSYIIQGTMVKQCFLFCRIKSFCLTVILIQNKFIETIKIVGLFMSSPWSDGNNDELIDCNETGNVWMKLLQKINLKFSIMVIFGYFHN